MAELCRFQKFTPQRLHRSQLKNADYNPRQLDQYARKKLERNLKKTGLIQSITWNKRTGNIVGGHQRVAILDTLEGSADYLLDVDVVDMPLKQEKEANIFLNNAAAQGTWDLDKLGDLIKSPDFDIEDAGFDINELKLLVPMDAPAFTPAYQADAPAEKAAEQLQEMKAARKEFRAQTHTHDQNAQDFYVIAVFQTSEERADFMNSIEIDPNNQYVDGNRLKTLLAV